MKHEGKEIAMKMPALNKWLHASGGVCPQTVLWKPPLRQTRLFEKYS